MSPRWTVGLPKHGDFLGDPNPGHKVDRVWAAVVMFADGSEGLASAYMGGEDAPTSRVTLVTSDPKMLRMMKRMIAGMEPPPGGRFEWRTYRQSKEAV